MGDEEHGLALLRPDFQKLPLHDLAGLRVERGEGLVHQQHIGVDGQRPGEVDALAHAARELAGVVLGEAGEAHQLQQALGQGMGRRRLHAAHLQPEDHIVEHRAPGKQGIMLEHKAAIAARPLHQFAVDAHLAFFSGDQAADGADEGRLAAAAGAHDADEFVGGDIKRNGVEHLAGLAIAGEEIFREMGDLKLGGHQWVSCTLLRQGARRCSRYFSPSMSSTPMREKISTPRNTVAVSKLRPAAVMR